MTLESPGRLLDRFHGVLLSEIRRRRPEYLSDPFTVAEIYQHLVPYASHRDRLGVEMNGDYEDVLLRLLAGEGDYLTLESAPARERLREALDSPNPDTSMYREYAAASVRLNPERVADAAAGGDGVDEPAEPAGDAVRPGERAEPALPLEEEEEPAALEEPAPPPDVEPGAPVASPVEGHSEPSPEHAGVEAGASPPETCSWCRERLPRRDHLNYCPFCGTDVRLVPCPDCGEALEPGWRFCVVCGGEVAGG